MSIATQRNPRFRPRLSIGWLALVLGAFALAEAADLRAQPPVPAPAPSVIRTRRNIATLTPAQTAALRQGVKVMKGRPATDPTSWLYQANMHGTFDTPVKTAWNSCQHGSFFFLSWHRMYLYYFERILRKASGDPNLTLSYWNYSDPTQRAIPLAFRSPASTATNSLFTSLRAPGVNTGGQLPSSAVTFASAFAFTNFSSAAGSGLSFGGPKRTTPAHSAGPAGSLENTPHGPVHVIVGGSSGLMSAFETAARDPIFWLHHANIDRLWNRWLQQGGGRQNPTTDNAWMTTKFTFFDENGAQVQMTGAQVLSTANQLRYRYDDDPPNFLVFPTATGGATVVAPPRPREVIASGVASIELGAEATRVSVAVPAASRPKVAAAFGDEPKVGLTLALEDISVDKQPGVYYEVYVNLPASEKNPDSQSPHYVGNLSLFGFGAHGDHAATAAEGGPSFNFELSGAARALKEEGLWNDEEVTVTLVPRGLTAAPGKPPLPKLTVGGKVKVGKVSVATE
jgi:tyrosinase